MKLFPDQLTALEIAKQSQVFILTGAPGTGKSTVAKEILDYYEGRELRCVLAAPSGKAAKRMYECTGRQASTIHKLLEPEKVKDKFIFTRNADNPIQADLILLDEVSMVDTTLMARLLEAVAPGTILVMLGDIHQLPSVGPGNILKDMILSGLIPCTELTIIKRQDEGLIIKNCHHIKNGRDIEFDNSAARDFFFMQREEELDIRETILELISKRLPESYKLDPLRDIQIITPLREKTELSCKALNELCQAQLNPNPKLDNCSLKVGDKLVQIKNDYEYEIVNGDIGYVKSIDKGNRLIGVEFENPTRMISLPLYGNDLELAYALTCVAADTWIWTEKGMCRISDLGSGLPTGTMKNCKTAVGTQAGMHSLERVIHVGKEPTVRIRTRLGLDLEMSRNHRLLTVDRISGEERWVQASELVVGMRLPVPRGQRFGHGNEVSTEEFRPSSHPNGHRNGAYWPLTVNEKLAEVLGALVADGNYTDREDARVELAKADPLRSYIRTAVEELFGIKCRDWHEHQANIGRFYFHNKTVREFLYWCGLDYVFASEKNVPPVILISPPRIQAAFLRGLFSGDGSVTSVVVFTSTSEILTKQVHLLLLNLGILSRRYLMRAATDKWSAAWRIDISGQDINRFNQAVGFCHPYKRNAALFLRSYKPLPKTNWDNIPGGAHAARELRKALRNRDGRNYRASSKAKKVLSDTARCANHLAYHHVDFLIKEIEDFDSLGVIADRWFRWSKQRWFYDEITAIESREADLYDLTVSGPHSYLSNGLVSHNCHRFQGSESPIVIIPIHRCFGQLILQRNWVYTAISRAKKVCILVGQVEEIPKIIRRNQQQKRFTNLAEFLRGKED